VGAAPDIAAGAAEAGPVFVTGLNRSGKSLFSMLLSSHPQIAIPRRESRFWTTIGDRFGPLDVPANLERCLEAVVASHDWGQTPLDRRRLAERFRVGPPTYEGLYAACHQEFAASKAKRRWGAHGQGLEHRVDHLIAAYPGCRIIHLVRDPRDGCAELRASERQLGRRLWPGQVAIHAERWLEASRRASVHETRHPEAYLVLRYEDLVSDPQAACDAVCRFLGEPGIPNAARVADVWGLLGGVGYFDWSSDHVGSYRRELSRGEISYVQTRLGPAMAERGYAADPIRLSTLDRLALGVVKLPVYQARLALYRLKQRLRARRSAAGRAPARP